jgi:glutamyl-Q tRNA(Asp) synthetase
MTGQDSSAHPIPTFRFAPSPNGYLHLGHAFSAVLNCDMARKTGGRFLLRIEDIDTARSRPEFETAIYEDLDWLGLAWEEPVRRQSEHFASYAAALKRLDAMGLIYPSFESRAEIARLVAERERVGPWPRDPDGVPIYPGEAKALEPAERTRRITAGEPYGLRLDVAAAIQLAAARTSSHASVAGLTWTEMGRGPAGESGTVVAAPAAWGDVILGRKDAPASYHLAVAVDDALQGITDVVRGEDLFWATGLHRLLQLLLDLPQPVYHHHRLIRDVHGGKLSKSTGATGLRELRAAGATPADVRRLIE